MSDFEKDNKTEEEKKEDFLNILKLMTAVSARNAELNAEEEMKKASFTIGKILYSTYSGMLAAGFNEKQALDLTKCVVFGTRADDVLKR